MSTLINKESSDIKPTVKILSDKHDRTRPEIFSNTRVPGEIVHYNKVYACFNNFLFLTTFHCFLLFISTVLRMRPIEQTKVNDETRNASNTENSNLAESTVAKMKIDRPKDPFAKHSTGM